MPFCGCVVPSRLLAVAVLDSSRSQKLLVYGRISGCTVGLTPSITGVCRLLLYCVKLSRDDGVDSMQRRKEVSRTLKVASLK